MSYACCSFRKHKRRELIWFRVLVLLRGFGRAGSANPAVQQHFSASDEDLGVGSPGSPSQALLHLRETNTPCWWFFFFPLNSIFCWYLEPNKLNWTTTEKICWASGINSGFHFPGSHSCPQHRHWEGAGMLLQDRICGCRSDSWGAAGPSHPQQIAAAAEQESWAVLHCRCRSSVLLQFCSAPAPVHPNSSS